jgi:hypothetical protein
LDEKNLQWIQYVVPRPHPKGHQSVTFYSLEQILAGHHSNGSYEICSKQKHSDKKKKSEATRELV